MLTFVLTPPAPSLKMTGALRAGCCTADAELVM
jgi:hypothetical protein